MFEWVYCHFTLLCGKSCRNSAEILIGEEIAPIIPATISEEPWNPHNYTNVDFAQASVQGQAANGRSSNIRSRKSRMYVYVKLPHPCVLSICCRIRIYGEGLLDVLFLLALATLPLSLWKS